MIDLSREVEGGGTGSLGEIGRVDAFPRGPVYREGRGGEWT